MKKSVLLEKINAFPARSAWDKAVKTYAYEVVEDLDVEEISYNPGLSTTLLNGASSWPQYSFSGCSLCYDVQIAERIMSPSEFKRWARAKNPLYKIDLLATQATALFQAEKLIRKLV